MDINTRKSIWNIQSTNNVKHRLSAEFQGIITGCDKAFVMSDECTIK